MKLKKIAVSGFKSFVDKTEVSFNTQVVGVVGPNGCGKSNVIDAVRWVMGESSAKMLRGESMDDVIFNGSSTRKPVSRASVELHFDNSLGRIKSHYKQFAEIVIKRVLTREGQSEYRINDKRVRRKDVLDLFRGTGLGPRSYSIIEQGMVSRIVEAKPEELRSYVEEAAGVTRYKDKRRETENRIRQTRENVERSEDIRGELLAQLRRLKRQANSAQRYKNLQAKRRETQSILYKLKFDDFAEQITEQQKILDESNNLLEKNRADQREIEADIEHKRSDLGSTQDTLTNIQADFYKAGAEISKIEQKIEHIKANEAHDAKALSEINDALTQLEGQVETDDTQLEQFRQSLTALMPTLELGESQLAHLQSEYNRSREQFTDWQNRFNQHQHALQTQTNQKQLQLSIIDQINRQQGRAHDRKTQLDQEQAKLSAQISAAKAGPKEAELAKKQSLYAELKKQIELQETQSQQAFEAVIDTKNKLNEQRAILSATQTRVESLQEFQVAALSNRHKSYQQWAESNKVNQYKKLAEFLEIEKGWERAADRVLAPYLNALIDENGQHAFWLNLAEHELTMVSKDIQKQVNRIFPLPLLSDFIKAKDIDVAALVAGVYVADDAQIAQQERVNLSSAERIVTREGTLFGANWVSHAGVAAQNTGYLVREEEVHSLKQKVVTSEETISNLLSQLEQAEQADTEAKTQLNQFQTEQAGFRQQISQAQREVAQLNTAQEYTQSRLNTIEQEINDIRTHGIEEQDRLSDAEHTLKTVEGEKKTSEVDTASLAAQEQEVKEAVEKANLAYREQQNIAQTAKLEQTRLDTSIQSLQNNLSRMNGQIQQHKQRKQNLLNKHSHEDAPIGELDKVLETHLAEHKDIEIKLLASRDKISGLDNQLRVAQSGLSACIESVNQVRGKQEDIRMGLQDRQIRQQSLCDEAVRDHYSIDSVQLPEEQTSIQECELDIVDYERKIASIGAVNLVAIDEYETQSERADYLEKQHKDLLDALETLEKVIRKIDKETRTRFEETYTALNKSFTNYFPKLFGGGRASLSLTSDDWLTTGVSVMAQPPGKRNSTIHLLSGGEKALTAVSLLFALFELNPAPFCMMDEVDAPLDDANVERFCDTLKSLSEHAQIIVITHNKITMQVATHLIGVTQNEPGVSRVVSVDVEQAMDLMEES